MKTFSTSGTGSQQTLSEIENNKIPIYDTKTDAESDLANLTVGQIIATKDEGNETSTPVDVVQDGNMHAVTSNAVAAEIAGLVKQEEITCAPDSSGSIWILDKYAKGLINIYPKPGALSSQVYYIQIMATAGVTPNGIVFLDRFTNQPVTSTFQAIVTYIDF